MGRDEDRGAQVVEGDYRSVPMNVDIFFLKWKARLSCEHQDKEGDVEGQSTDGKV